MQGLTIVLLTFLQRVMNDGNNLTNALNIYFMQKKVNRKMRITVLLCIIFISKSFPALAWGPEGHAIVGRLAMQFVKEDVRKNVLAILGNMSVDTAANWMDIMKSNADYDFMRTWHYLDFPRDQVYASSNNENIVNRLILTYNELTHKKVLCTEQVRADLYVLLHLMGDLHMPLHTGYDDDLGGNKVMVQYDTLKTHNLHTFWDVDIIRLGNITDNDCLQLLNSGFKDSSRAADFTGWMLDSRSLLPQVYDFPGFTLDKKYLDRNRAVVVRQLLKAGLRLAALLNKLFPSPAAVVNFAELTKKYKNGIDVKDAMNYVGKEVTICARVYSIRATTAITQVSVGEAYPNNPLTIIVFAKNYTNFTVPVEDMLKDKNICVKGKIELYKGKPQIIVEKPGEITVL
jgi:S1/P1 Nuclease